MARRALLLIEKNFDISTILVLLLTVILVSVPFGTSLVRDTLTLRSSGVISYNVIEPLHIEGKNIKDSFGRVVQLKGVNRGHIEEDPSGQWGGWDIFDPADLEIELNEMRSWGINALRLYARVDYWINNSPANTPTGTLSHRQVVKTIIQKAAEKGIYVIYCPWSLGSGSQDAYMPFPPYTDRTDIIPNENAFVNYWVSVANELRGCPNVLYEVFNEPNDGAGIGTDMDDWYRVWQKVINGIRATGDDHIIVIQWGYSTAYDPGWGPDLAWIMNYPFNDTAGNLLYSTHLYRIYGDYGQDMPYAYSTIKQRFNSSNMKIGWVRDQWNKPFIIGEFGAWEPDWYAPGYELRAFNSTLRILNEWGISYTAWDWTTGAGFNLLADTWYNVAPNAAGNILVERIADTSK